MASRPIPVVSRITDSRAAFYDNKRGHSSNLISLDLPNPFTDLTLPLLEVPYTALTTLQLADRWPTRPSNLRKLFKQFPNLLHFSHCGHNGGETIMEGISILRAPPLHSLLLRGNPRLLNFLTIPTLKHLQVALWNDLGPAHVAAFTSRSGCHSSHLTIDAAGVRDTASYKSPCSPLFSHHSSPRDPISLPRTGQAPPSVPTLLITDETERETYNQFLAVLRARPTRARAELHLRPRHGGLCAHRIDVHVSTPTFDFHLGGQEDDVLGDLGRSGHGCYYYDAILLLAVLISSWGDT
ncbi:hypothetical protein DFH07DRAFT_962292 [Mycena maculata]|uniref:Uncharacterized protein n=1 Tax=Mycena maculata TaxID=230809 RepID=A0AAD7IQP6_9AGAR|nr:hypothetical protein DFH07DRAFT_962292 [Mycena maculata]